MRKVGEPLNVVVCGTRTWTDYSAFAKEMDKILQGVSIGCIISGMARGVDAMAELYAKERRIMFRGYAAKWHIYGKYAGPRRNALMAKVGHATIAFWDGKSKGTKNMIEEARKRNHELVLICRIPY